MTEKHLELSNLRAELDQLVIKLKANGDIKNYQNPMYDGPLNIEEYFKSDLKIIWVLKEAYDGPDGSCSGWNYAEAVGGNPNAYLLTKLNKTWLPIAYTSFGIQNKLKRNEMKKVRDDLNSYHEALRKISLVNINKLAAVNETSSPYSQVKKAFARFKQILKKQIEILEPDVIIWAGTDDWMWQLFGNSILKEERGKNTIWKLGKVILIPAYHPANTKIKNENYIDDIINTAHLGLK